MMGYWVKGHNGKWVHTYHWKPMLIFAIIAGIIAMFIPSSNAIPESWRTCNLDEVCAIGDHVYNDSYVPYTDQICTINITYPNGTMAVTDADMDNNSLGFHNYSFTPPINGYYPVEMYCTNGIDSGRADRSFTTITPKNEEVNIAMAAIAFAILAASFFFVASGFEKSEEELPFRMGFLIVGILLAANTALIVIDTTTAGLPGFKLIVWVIRIATPISALWLVFRVMTFLTQRLPPSDVTKKY